MKQGDQVALNARMPREDATLENDYNLMADWKLTATGGQWRIAPRKFMLKTSKKGAQKREHTPMAPPRVVSNIIRFFNSRIHPHKLQRCVFHSSHLVAPTLAVVSRVLPGLSLSSTVTAPRLALAPAPQIMQRVLFGCVRCSGADTSASARLRNKATARMQIQLVDAVNTI